jgi:hypothetical protein
MARRIRRALTFANVCSFLALTIALGTGGAYAAATIGSADIIDDSIQSVDIKNGEVKNTDIATNQITTSRIHDDGVTNPDIAADAINSSKVAPESLTASDLATDSVGPTEIQDGAIDSGEIYNDSLFDYDLATGSVRSPEIFDGAVATADLASNSVTGAKVANNSLTTADVAGTDSNGSISLGAGSVANGRCKSYDITVGGAKQNETIVISTRAALPAGLLLYGQQVPADGHGIMTVCNLSGATMPALTDFPIRTVTFG